MPASVSDNLFYVKTTKRGRRVRVPAGPLNRIKLLPSENHGCSALLAFRLNRLAVSAHSDANIPCSAILLAVQTARIVRTASFNDSSGHLKCTVGMGACDIEDNCSAGTQLVLYTAPNFLNLSSVQLYRPGTRPGPSDWRSFCNNFTRNSTDDESE